MAISGCGRSPAFSSESHDHSHESSVSESSHEHSHESSEESSHEHSHSSSEEHSHEHSSESSESSSSQGHTHTLVSVAKKDATCTDSGNIAYQYCSGCGDIYDLDGHVITQADIVIPATNHNWGNWVTSREATCETDGEEKRVCNNDSTHVETRVIDKLNHDYQFARFEWNTEDASNVKAKAVYVCTHDNSHIQSFDAEVTETKKVAADCDNAELIYLKATYDKLSESKVFEGSVASGHEYKFDHFIWAQDSKSAVAYLVCEHNIEHIQQVNATMTNSEKTPLGCLTDQVLTYRATYGTSFEERDVTGTKAVGSHTPQAAVIENNADPTCSENGHYDEVVYCAVCHEKISTTHHDVNKTNHTPKETVRENEVAATCTADGSYDEVVYCKDCDAEISRHSHKIAATGHTPDEPIQENVVAATYEQNGSYDEVVKCKDCGVEISRNARVIAALVHTWSAWTTVTPATCDSKGQESRKCLDDTSIADEVRDITKLQHNYKVKEVVPPTCTEKGYTVYECEHCHDTYSSNFVDAKGHTWDHDTQSCQYARECTICHEIEEALPHSYVKDPSRTTPATCTENGKEVYVCEYCGDEDIRDNLSNLKLGHDYKLSEVPTETPCVYSKVYTCSHDSSHTFTDGTVERHNYVEQIITNPTCKEAGSKKYVCKDCGAVLKDGENEKIDIIPVDTKDGHNWVEKSFDSVTSKRTDECSICGETRVVTVYKDTSSLTAGSNLKDNDLEFDAATLSVDSDVAENLGSKNVTIGVTSSSTDSISTLSEENKTKIGDNLVYDFTLEDEDNNKISDLGGYITITIPYTLKPTDDPAHIVVYYIADDNTLEVIDNASYSNGYVTFKTNHFSSFAIGTLTAEDICDIFGHEYDEILVEGDCTHDSYIVYTCKRCGDTYQLSLEDHTGHDYQEASKVDATCTATGSITYECSRCHDSYKVLVPALGHSFGEWTVKTPATCTSNGKQSKECERCHTVVTEVIPMIGHDYEVKEVVNPTCTDDGYTVYECSHCHDSYEADYTVPTGHSFGEWTVKTPATCTTSGIEERTCTECGYKETRIMSSSGHKAGDPAQENYVAATCTTTGGYDLVVRCSECNKVLMKSHVTIQSLGHKYGEWVIDTEATCSTDGLKHRVCINDESHIEYEVIPATGKHNYKEYKENEVEATCSKAGSYDEVIKCEDCGKIYSSTHVTIPALGHDYGEWVVTNEPTCTIPGYQERVCSRDKDHKEVEEIAPLGHTPGEAIRENEVPATCTTNGHYDEVVKCTTCGKEISRTVREIPALGHEWSEWKVIEGGSCTVDHVEQRVCKNDATHIETKTVKATGHKAGEAVKENEVAPTCTEDGGYDEVVYCIYCNEELSRTHKVVPALDHDWSEWKVIEGGSCTEDHVEQRVCKNDETHIDTKRVPASGHTPSAAVRENEVAPTCTTEGGYDEVIYCSSCGQELSRTHKAIAALDHDYGEWTIVENGSCTEDHVEQRVCKNDSTHIDTKTVKATGHTPAEAVKENEVAPTCTKPGSYDEVVYCSVCHEELSRESKNVPALGHTPSEVKRENIKEATCTEDGSYDEVVYCSVCGEELSRTSHVEEALGHDWGEWKVTVGGNCTVDHIEQRVCKNDPTHIEAKTVPATGHKAEEAVKENEVAPTCTEKGSYDEVVYCSVCGEELSRETKEIPALGHSEAEAVRENEVAPTCTEKGSYDEVVYCSVCGEELSRNTVKVDALGHTEGSVVIENRVEPTCSKEGSYDEVIYCTVCNEELSRVTKSIDKVPHTPATAVKENEVAPTCTKPGSYDEVVYCSVCGEEISRTVKEVPATGHTKGEVVKENIVNATCTEDGSYDEVIYCTVCHEELSRTHKVVEALGHDWGEWEVTEGGSCTVDHVEQRVCKNDPTHKETKVVPATGHTEGRPVKENEVAPTCTKPGSYDEVVYCSVCGEEISRTVKAVPATGHTEGRPVKENEVAPTCTEDGGYDEVTYCSICHEELSRKHVKVEALGHKEGEVRIENDVPATCDEDGHHDEVVYCSICHEELSRKSVDVPATGHNWGKWIEVVPPTCTEKGQEERICINDKNHVEYRDVDATGHIAHKWTYDESGHFHVCEVCGLKYDEEAHKLNDNAVCEICGYKESGEEVCSHENAYKVDFSLKDYGYCSTNPTWEFDYCPDCGLYLISTTATLAQPTCKFDYRNATPETIKFNGKEYTFAKVTCPECGKSLYQYGGEERITDCSTIRTIIMGIEGEDGMLFLYGSEPYEYHSQTFPYTMKVGCEGSFIQVMQCKTCGEYVSFVGYELKCRNKEVSEGDDYVKVYCPDCGLHIDNTRVLVLEDHCYKVYDETVRVYDENTEYVNITRRNSESNHELETTVEFVNGIDCSEGVTITTSCKKCDYYDQRQSDSHIYSQKDTIDLKDYGIEGRIYFAKCEACGNERFEHADIPFETEYRSEPTPTSYIEYYTNEKYGFTHIVTNEGTLDGCKSTRINTHSISVGDKFHKEFVEKYVSYNHVSDEEHETYELLGKDCGYGVRVTATCKNCGETYSYNYYGHLYKDRVIDLVEEEGFCDGVLTIRECKVCGATSNEYSMDLDIDKHDIKQSQNSYEDENGMKHGIQTMTCSECGFIAVTEMHEEKTGEYEITTHYIMSLYNGEELIFRTTQDSVREIDNPNKIGMIEISVPGEYVDVINEAFNIFVKRHPEYTDPYLKINTNYNNIWNSYDIAYFSSDNYALSNLINKKVASKLSEELSAYIKANMEEGIVDFITADGDVYGLPISIGNGYFMYYDKSAFPENFDFSDLDAIVAYLKENNKKIAFGYDNGWYNASFFMGADVYSEWTYDGEYAVSYEDNYNSEQGIIAYEALQQFLNSGVVINTGEIYKYDNVAVVISGTWDYDNARNRFANLGTTVLPSYTYGDEEYQLGTIKNGYYLVKKEQDKESRSNFIDAFLAYLATPEMQYQLYSSAKSRSNTVSAPANTIAFSEAEKTFNDAEKALYEQLELKSHLGTLRPGNWWSATSMIGNYARNNAPASEALSAYAEMIADAVQIPHDHEYEMVDIYFNNGKDCSEGGYVKYVCSQCGDSYTRDIYGHQEHRYRGYFTDEYNDDVIMFNIEYTTCDYCHEIVDFSYEINEDYLEGKEQSYTYEGVEYEGTMYSNENSPYTIFTGESVVKDGCNEYSYKALLVLDNGEVNSDFVTSSKRQAHTGTFIMVNRGGNCTDGGAYVEYYCSTCGEMIESGLVYQHEYNENGVCIYCGASESTSGGQTYYRPDSNVVYNNNLGHFSQLVDNAMDEMDDDYRFVLEAEAEAELLDNAILLPLNTSTLSYMMTRVAPNTTPKAEVGIDSDRVKNLIAIEYDSNKLFITAEDYAALNNLYTEALKGNGEYDPAAYLVEHGYTIASDIAFSATDLFRSLDIFEEYSALDQLANLVEGLVEFDQFGNIVPRLAKAMPTISEDGLTYTFEIREDAYWYDASGNQVAPITADDFVAGYQHSLDEEYSYYYLFDGVIVGTTEYLAEECSFEDVGVKAVDGKLVITLVKPTKHLLSLLTHCLFPLNRAFYTSRGGAFGVSEFNDTRYDGSYSYGDPNDNTSILYNSAFIYNGYDRDNKQYSFRKNMNYYDADKVTLDSVTYHIIDYSEETYNKAINGLTVSTALSSNNETLELARKSGYFDEYAVLSKTGSATFYNVLNINRMVWDYNSVKSSQTYEQAIDTHNALNNANFRRAIQHAFNKYDSLEYGNIEECAYASMRNMLTKPDFVYLSKDVTVDGVTFEAGTSYGEIVQYYLTNKYNRECDVSDGQNGWYNPELAQYYLGLAKEELGEDFGKVVIDIVVYQNIKSQVYAADKIKERLESILGPENIEVSILYATSSNDYYYTTYYADSTGPCVDFMLGNVGWGPDYLDPFSYLQIFLNQGLDSDQLYLAGIVGGNEEISFGGSTHQHDMQLVDSYAINGDCDIGIVRVYECSTCGYRRNELSRGHYFESQHISLEQYGVPNCYIDLFGCSGCGKVLSMGHEFNIELKYEETNYIDEAGNKHEVITYTSDEYDFTYSCDLYYELIEGCQYRTHRHYTLKAGEYSLDFEQNDEITSIHDIEERYELLGETCEDGWIKYEYCNKCDYESQYQGDGHSVSEDSTKIDNLDEYGLVGVQSVVERCEICNSIVTVYFEGLGNYIDQDIYLTEQDENGITHYYQKMYNEDESLSYIVDEYEVEESCITYWHQSHNFSYQGYELHEEIVNKREKHDWKYSVTLYGDDCDDGYKGVKTCAKCGKQEYVEAWGHHFNDMELTKENGDQLAYVYCCEICHLVFNMNVNVKAFDEIISQDTYYDERGYEHQVVVYRASNGIECECDTYYEPSEHPCVKNVVTNYKLSYEGKTYEYTSSYEECRHSEVENYEMYGDDCDDGYRIIVTCEKCGEFITEYESYGHITNEESIDLGEYGYEGAQITEYVCKLCKKTYDFYITYNGELPKNKENKSYEDEEGITHMVTTYMDEDKCFSFSQDTYDVINGCIRTTYTSYSVVCGEFKYSTSVERSSECHDYSKSYYLHGGNCSDGWTCKQTCNNCFHEESYTGDYHSYITRDIYSDSKELLASVTLCEICGEVADYKVNEDLFDLTNEYEYLDEENNISHRVVIYSFGENVTYTTDMYETLEPDSDGGVSTVMHYDYKLVVNGESYCWERN